MSETKDDKYNHLFQWAIYVFEQEESRFEQIDQKAARYLSGLTLFAGIAGFFIDSILRTILPLDWWLEWLIVLSALSVVILLGMSWWSVFGVLRIGASTGLPLDSSLLKFYRENTLININFGLTKGILDAVKSNRKNNDSKAERLTYGYWLIIGLLGCLSVLVSSFTVHRWIDIHQSSIHATNMMPKQTPSPPESGGDRPSASESSQDQPDSNSPDPDVSPPDFPTINKGYSGESTRESSNTGTDGTDGSADD